MLGCCSVTQLHLFVTHGLQHARFPYPSLSPGVCLKGKDSDVGKIEGRKRRGQQRMRWLDGIINSMGMSGFVIAFFPRSKCLLISWPQSSSAVILEPKKIKSVTVSIVSPSICFEVMWLDGMILVVGCWVLSQFFHSPFSPSSGGSLVPLHFLPLGWLYLHIWGYWYSSSAIFDSSLWFI